MLMFFFRMQNRPLGSQIASSGHVDRSPRRSCHVLHPYWKNETTREYERFSHSESTSIPPPSKMPDSTDMVENILPVFAQLRLHSKRREQGRFARSTRQEFLPTWGQIKQLSCLAEQILEENKFQKNPANLFLAMISLLTIRVRLVLFLIIIAFPCLVGAEPFMAYLLDPPPYFHPATWAQGPIKVTTNDT